jgi:predicted acetyltransferase
MAAMTALPDGYTLLPATDELIPDLLAADRMAFGYEFDEQTAAELPFPLPLERTVAVAAPDGSLAAMHGSYAFTLPVPGGAVPCAGLTWVGVHPAHRRRGLLRSMIDTHLARTADRGEAVSILCAAEEGIYGRFGYGRAADEVRLTLPRGAALRDVPGSDALSIRFRPAGPADVELVDRLHRQAGSGRPGWATRDSDVIRRLVRVDPPALRKGGEGLQLATVLDRAGEVRAAALLRRTEAWEDTGPRFTVEVREASALDPAASHRLWSFLLDLDLTARVLSPRLATDDALLHLLVDRRAAAPRLSDNVWLRLVDLPAALEARRYAAPLDVVLQVRDELLAGNDGRWRLSAAPGAPTQVVATTEAADLVLDVRELGAAYLGGRSLSALVRAGLVEERTVGAAGPVDAAFGSPLAPFCSWMF